MSFKRGDCRSCARVMLKASVTLGSMLSWCVLPSKGMSKLKTSGMLGDSAPFLMEVKPESSHGTSKLVLTLHDSLTPDPTSCFCSLGTRNEELRILVST